MSRFYYAGVFQKKAFFGVFYGFIIGILAAMFSKLSCLAWNPTGHQQNVELAL